jgi:hypothetical protein
MLAVPAFAQTEPASRPRLRQSAWANLSACAAATAASPYANQWAAPDAGAAGGTCTWQPALDRNAVRSSVIWHVSAFSSGALCLRSSAQLMRERHGASFARCSPEQQNMVRDNFHRFQHSVARAAAAICVSAGRMPLPAERQKMIARARARRGSPGGSSGAALVQGRGRLTGSGTLQRSIRPAGTLYHSSRRLRRASTSSLNVAVSVRITSSCERCASGTSAASRID